jgi:hypothetical protein
MLDTKSGSAKLDLQRLAATCCIRWRFFKSRAGSEAERAEGAKLLTGKKCLVTGCVYNCKRSGTFVYLCTERRYM